MPSEWKPNQQKFGTKYKVLGKDYPTPDLYAKVTGQAKYAEDFRAEGMLFCKLLLSPVPHGRVKHLDVSKAMAMPGVKAILTQDDLPAPADSVTDLGVTIKANPQGEKALTNEPLYQGEPVLAVAAVDEFTAAEAIEAIDIEFEHLPFAVDPLDSLRPGGPNARVEGNVWIKLPVPEAKTGENPPSTPPPKVGELKWTEADFHEANDGRLPMGKPQDEWKYGDLEAGFKNAALVLDETFVTPDTSHQTLEPRSTLAYWQNGKVFVHMGTQSTVQTLAGLGRWLNMDPGQIVLISEYTGGGFGSKATGYIFAIIPALLSKKIGGAPVMMRISREEENFIGRGRPGFQGRMKVGFSKDGRITAVDMYAICNNGPYDAVGDANASGNIVSLLYQPPAMRWRGVTVLTNTPPRGPQSAPGGMQGIVMMEPLLSKAARKLSLDQVEIRKANCPEGKSPWGPERAGKRAHSTSAFLKEAFDSGAEQFRWKERLAQPKRSGSKVRGVGVSSSCFFAGSVGYDGLFLIKPDGHIVIQSGIGNLGTESIVDVHRVVAEELGVPWEKCDVIWGNTAKNLPWTCVSGGSQTTHAMSRAAYAASLDAKRKLQEIGAKIHGGQPEQYEVANERVFHKGGGGSMTLAQAAQHAIKLGGIYDGHEAPAEVNKYTKASIAALAGQGLVASAKDKFPHDGQSFSYVACFAEVEVDVETGKYYITDYLAVADVGTVIHPRALGGQITGRSILGIGHAIGQKWVFDPQYGHFISRRFYHTKPPTILDVPTNMQWAALDMPDPETPVGARGIGEPPVGGGCGAILNALSDALGDEVYRRAPVNLDTILTSLEAGRPMQDPLTAFV